MPLDTLLYAQMTDLLSLLVWAQTKDAQHGRNRPKSIYKLLSSHLEEDNKIISYDSGKEFDIARQRILDSLGGEAECRI